MAIGRLIILFSVLCFLGTNLYAQTDSTDYEDAGVAVSPAHINVNLEPGESTTERITVNNQTKKLYKFRVLYKDFNMDRYGKSTFDYNPVHGLSKWMTIAPTYFEVKPGEKKEVAVTITIPNEPEANIAAWNAVFVEQTVERKTLDPGNDNGQTIALGVIPSFSFGVWVYQNPPNVENNRSEIKNFQFREKNNGSGFFLLSVKNEGDGISFCRAYIELTNLSTGKQVKLGGKSVIVLPGYHRTFRFDYPGILAPGKYSAIGVVDYGNKEELIAAELEFTIEKK